MRIGAPLRDELVAQAAGERQVGHAIAVQVAELAAAEPELDPADAMGALGDLRADEQLAPHGVGQCRCVHGGDATCAAAESTIGNWS